MFKRSRSIQGDMFKSLSIQLGKRKQKLLDDPKAWHNVFYKEVLSRIDESPYSVLYDDVMGRPNSSIRIMISMMVLKEGQGWSDEQLFEACSFDIKVMHALGLFHIDQDVPAESTYYEFRRLLTIHNAAQSRDLLKWTFADITAQQAKELNIKGKKIRMDSKLINSNIAKSTRLQLILEATRKYLSKSANEYSDIPSKHKELRCQLRTKTSSNISYSLSIKEKKEMLVQLGQFIKYLLSKDTTHVDNHNHILSRIYKEHYQEDKEDKDNPGPKAPKDISSTSIQSAHDIDAAYRCKGQGASKQRVSGYHANIVESCDEEDSINLILDVEVIPANICEDAFLESAINQSEQILQKEDGTHTPIEEVITDGGYDSIANREEMLKGTRPKWRVAKTKGGKRRYNITKSDQNKIVVIDVGSGTKCKVTLTKNKEKYIIHNPEGSRRYMTLYQIENYLKRQEIESQADTSSYNLRANVESTIHQCFHRLKKRNKIVYRRQIKCQWYVISRALWVNMTRIVGKNFKFASYLLLLHLWYILNASTTRYYKNEIQHFSIL
jgi:hypothetical protein